MTRATPAPPRDRYAFLCDFDGTIAPADIGASFMRAFTRDGDGEARRAELLEAWRRGSIGSRELTEAECAMVRATAADAAAFAGRWTIDPTFAAFAREARGRGDTVLVVSDGFEFYIRPLLVGAGLGDLAVTANRLRFEEDRATPEFPNAGQGCGRCGNCKGAPARAARARGDIVVAIGDGLSDRCMAREADHVFARGQLAEWCAAEGIAARDFADFAALAALARELPGRAGAGVPGGDA